MKIILCIFLLNITAVSVFGRSVELNDIVGQSVKFPAAVEKGGFLMYGGDPIGESSLGTPGIGKYSGRVQWDKCTGLFSLSGLKMEDIGEYKVQNTDKNITVFQLNVYKDNVNVSKPHVSITQNEYPCSIECTAERGTEATLSWYREGQTTPYSRSSVRSAPHLDLPQTVERSGTYTCEAKNSVSNEKASITVGDHCTAPTSSSTGIIVASVIAAVAVLIAVVFAFLYCRVRRDIRAVRTLIQVKMLLDNVDVHAYDETVPSDAIGSLIEVKNIIDNVDPEEYAFGSLIQGFKRRRRAVKTFIEVKKLFDNVDPHECGDAVQAVPQSGDAVQAVPQSAVGSLIEVKNILDNVDPQKYAFGSLIQGFKRKRRGFEGRCKVKKIPDNVDPHEYGFKRKRRGFEGRCKVKKIPDNVDPHEYGETRLALPPDDGRTLIQVKKLLNNVDLHAFGETRLELSPDGVRTVIHVKKLLDNLDLHAYAQYLFDHENSEASVKELLDDVDPSEYGDAVQAVPQSGETSMDSSPDGFKRKRRVKKILDNMDPHKYGLEAMKKMTSSHQTEVL